MASEDDAVAGLWLGLWQGSIAPFGLGFIFALGDSVAGHFGRTVGVASDFAERLSQRLSLIEHPAC